MNFRRIEKNYKTGLWTKQMVLRAYEKGYITKEEYFFITGDLIESTR